MSPSSATVQHVTNASGTVAIASSSTSIGVTKVTEGVSTDPLLLDNISSIVSTADIIAAASVVILALSFGYNVYSTRKRRQLDEAFKDLRLKEYELDLAKFKRKNQRRS